MSITQYNFVTREQWRPTTVTEFDAFVLTEAFYPGQYKVARCRCDYSINQGNGFTKRDTAGGVSCFCPE